MGPSVPALCFCALGIKVFLYPNGWAVSQHEVWDDLCPIYRSSFVAKVGSYLCSRDVFFGLFLEPVYVFFVLLLPFCSRHVFLCYFANLLVSFILILDVFQSEMWTEFFAAIPDHLQPLVSRVQETVLASRADGTIRTYLAAFRRWKFWASSNGIRHMPANPFQVSVYLQCLILEANSPSPVVNAVYSIDCTQQLAGLPKVSVHPMVSAMVSASQRILGKAKSKISDVSFLIGFENSSFMSHRTCWFFFVSVSYALFELVT